MLREGSLSQIDEAIHHHDFRRAQQLISAGLQSQPESIPLSFRLGQISLAVGRAHEAQAIFTHVLRVDPQFPGVMVALAKSLVALDHRSEAVKLLRSVGLENLEARHALAQLLADQFRTEEAIEVLRSTLERYPNDTDTLNSLAIRLNELASFDEAQSLFQQVIDQDPLNAIALHGIVQGRRLTEGDLSVVEQMERAASARTIPEEERTTLLFALGKAYGDLKLFKESFDRYREANQIIDRSISTTRPFSAERVSRLFDLTRNVFTREVIRARQTGQVTSPSPIFIVGMFRSGTTLAEQILSAHPQIQAGGEIDHWLLESGACLNVERQSFDFDRAFASRKRYDRQLSDISNQKPFVTDKMPGNYRSIGLIRILYPNAKFIHCVRDPMDTCLSIYMTQFKHPPDYSSDPAKIVFTYRKYRELMDHWKSVLEPGEVFELTYEKLVGDPEPVTRDLISFLGLEWDQSCLHPEQNLGRVNTASVWQARQPIYKTSRERWRNYQPWLGQFSGLRA